MSPETLSPSDSIFPYELLLRVFPNFSLARSPACPPVQATDPNRPSLPKRPTIFLVKA